MAYLNNKQYRDVFAKAKRAEELEAALRKLLEAAKLKEYDQETDGIDGTVLYCSECGERKYGLLRHKKHCPYAAAIAEAERLLRNDGE